jgi:hypothetical protein
MTFIRRRAITGGGSGGSLSFAGIRICKAEIARARLIVLFITGLNQCEEKSVSPKMKQLLKRRPLHPNQRSNLRDLFIAHLQVGSA